VVRVFVFEESPALSARLLERLRVAPELSVVGVARTVTDAIKEITTLTPDVVITDTEQTDGNGLALLHALQARRTADRRGPRVLLWTACRDARRQAVALRLGAEARFDKAREVERLVEYCRHAAAHCDE
jgi:DNA-binding NarL/FixJ family response regulator